MIITETSEKVGQLQQGPGNNQTLFEEINNTVISENSEEEEGVVSRAKYNPYQLAFNQSSVEKEKVDTLEKTVVGLGQTIERLNNELRERLADLNQSRQNIEALNEEIEHLRMLNLDQNSDNDSMDLLTKNLGELFSREEQKSIPLFSGQLGGKLIHDWLRTCRKIGDNNNWGPNTRFCFYSDRLSGEAADWHESFMKKQPFNPATYVAGKATTAAVPAVRYTIDDLPYEVLQQHFIDRFTNAGHKEKLRNKLQLLRQTLEQDVQSFIYNINNVYNMVNGEGLRLLDTATNGEKLLKEENDHLRNQEKLKSYCEVCYLK